MRSRISTEFVIPCKQPTILSVEAVASRPGAAGQKLSAQAGLSCAANLYSGALPGPFRASKQATMPSSGATKQVM